MVKFGGKAAASEQAHHMDAPTWMRAESPPYLELLATLLLTARSLDTVLVAFAPSLGVPALGSQPLQQNGFVCPSCQLACWPQPTRWEPLPVASVGFEKAGKWTEGVEGVKHQNGHKPSCHEPSASRTVGPQDPWQLSDPWSEGRVSCRTCSPSVCRAVDPALVPVPLALRQRRERRAPIIASETAARLCPGDLGPKPRRDEASSVPVPSVSHEDAPCTSVTADKAEHASVARKRSHTQSLEDFLDEDIEVEEVEEAPEEQKKADPLYMAEVRLTVDGQTFHCVVDNIDIGIRTKEVLYRIKFPDGDLQHLTADEVNASIIQVTSRNRSGRGALPGKASASEAAAPKWTLGYSKGACG